MTKENLNRFYCGNSMRSVFCPGDYLLVTPVLPGDIFPGDVIVFNNTFDQNNAEEIVHRVVAMTSAGLVTRGDNNLYCDMTPVASEDIIGQVRQYVSTGGQTKNVLNGKIGLWMVRIRWRCFFIMCHVRWLFSKPYQALRTSGLINRFWRPRITRVTFRTESGSFVKYLNEQRVVAIWDPILQRFECRKPYDLVIRKPNGPHCLPEN
jgi:signal peptidase I